MPALLKMIILSENRRAQCASFFAQFDGESSDYLEKVRLLRISQSFLRNSESNELVSR